MSDEQAWDARYSENDRIWSGDANVVLVREVGDLPAGRALDLGCGEGGDAIWLARRGWQVTAVDISGVALARAQKHASEAGVTVDWQKRDLLTDFPEGEFDLVSAQFLHFWGRFDREGILRRAAAAVAPGGILLIEGHLDTGPVRRAEHENAPELPGPAEVIERLELDEGWDVLVAEIHPREHIIDGVAHERSDNTVKLRRRA
ncbi:bifunctional 2-polyprenyl-6-hydroxyphenol methylase/3-demethylubiquinol 3-O-methyltransferase UbiG [Actinoplanes sp. M2I2]|uniref:class I SAM-dependent methyltransferase n=1 Tax=Actinoplanes sp. M2I2 TaxID=1734444 RepID=UPI00201FBEA7|nr:class I SAM-dependent methyltransferase [Actinoplanes sp. M2I2]